jgi:hypothetical protein
MVGIIKSFLIAASIMLIGCGSGKNPNASNPLRPLKPSDFPNQSGSIYGAWEADMAVFGEGGVAQFVTLYFNQKGEVGLLLECMDNEETISTSGTTDVSIFSGHFMIPRNVSLSAPGTKKVPYCAMTFAKGDYAFEVRGDQLRITSPEESEPTTYSRIR